MSAKGNAVQAAQYRGAVPAPSWIARAAELLAELRRQQAKINGRPDAEYTYALLAFYDYTNGVADVKGVHVSEIRRAVRDYQTETEKRVY